MPRSVMKVALVNLTSGGLSGGYAKYLAALLPLLARDPRVSGLDVFVAPFVAASYTFPVPVMTWPERDGFFGYRTLRARLADLAPDVLFFPTTRRLGVRAIPTVVMVRNMEPLTVPFGGNTWREGLRNLARARAAHTACRRASRVIAVSEHVREYLTGRWGLDPSRIGLVYHGVDPANVEAVTRPAGLSDTPPFLFTAGSIRPARGLEDLIRALPMVLTPHPGMACVIAGSVDRSGRAYAARLRRLAVTLGVDRRIVWTGSLTPAEMAWAFQRCAAFVVTSRAEACPNLALEAMSHGSRIVSTSRPPMPEFFSRLASYYSPDDPADLASKLTGVLSDPAASDARAREGIARTASFTWQRTADRTIEELQRAVETPA